MSDERTATTGRAASALAPLSSAELSADELWRLTQFKWRYSLESHGFSSEQARQLLFLKWLYSRGADVR